MSHSRLSQGESATRPWPVMKRRRTEGAGTSGASASSAPRTRGHGGHVGEVPRAHGGDVGAHGVGARATPVQARRVDLNADAATSVTRRRLVEHAPVAAPEVPEHAVARRRAAAKMCGRRDAAHGANGLTERGPACDHGSSTYSSLLSTYSRASADCSASHRSDPPRLARRHGAGARRVCGWQDERGKVVGGARRSVQQQYFWQRGHSSYKSTPLSSPPSTLHPYPPSRHIRRRMSDMPTPPWT